MSITYQKKEKIFHLKTQNSSYVFCVSDFETVEHLYYGKRIPDDDVRYIGNRQIYSFNAQEDKNNRRFVTSTVGLEVSAFNSGDIRTPSVAFDYNNDVGAGRLRYRSHKIYRGRKPVAGLPYSRETEDAESLELLLSDDEGGVELTLYYTVFEDTDVIARHQEIKNAGGGTMKVTKFASMCLDFYGSDYDAVALEGMYLYERAKVQRAPLTRGVYKNYSTVGATSHHANPFLALCAHNADEDSGEVYGFNLVYSGNFSEEVEVDRFGNTRLIAGLDDTAFCWPLKRGESLISPEAVMTYSDQGFGGMSRNFHDHIRASIIEREFVGMPRPIVINTWEASYFTVSEETMLRLAGHAASCGIDTVVLDDGWFRAHDNDVTGEGDWKTVKRKFPSGLKGLADKLHAMGLKFGLWLEPEMVNEESELYASLPEGILSTAKKPLIYRNEYVLDLTNDAVIDRIASRIAEELKGVEIDYIKWDCNRYLFEASSRVTPQGEVYHRYMLGVYKLFEILKKRLGGVMFESCSGGGGRFDLGMLFYSPQIWTSDNTDPYARVFIQYGTSFAYPMSAMSCHFTRGEFTSGRPSSFDFRYRVAEMGAYGYELDLGECSDADRAQFKKYSEEYRRDEALTLKGDLYRLLSPENTSFCAYMKVAKDKRRAKLTFLELNATGFIESMVLKLKGLAPEKKYRNEETGEILYGATLMNVGIRVGDLFRAKRENGYSVCLAAVDD